MENNAMAPRLRPAALLAALTLAFAEPVCAQSMHGMAMPHHGGGAPQSAGQDAFGAIQEIVLMLEADPKTDWSKVDLEALRQHLIDMNEVVLRAVATPKP